MKADDISLLELLDLNPDCGSITFKNRRMLLWDADAFGNLRNELIQSVGIDQARQLLKRFGFANGYRDALTMGSMFQWDNDSEWWLACPMLQRSQGKVIASPEHLLIDKQAGVFEMEVHWENSYEATQHVRVFGESDIPVCWTVSAYASGYSSALMGEEVYVVEEKCACQGHGHCHVVGKTKKAWGELGVKHAEDYQACGLAAQLDARDKELDAKQRIVDRQRRELRNLRRQASTMSSKIVYKSSAMKHVMELADTVASVDSTVLVTGESGVGKELLSRHIHDNSPRSSKQFMAINCGALPESLLESELFGHVKGSFTGADRDKQGLLETAQGGTVLLDEVGELSQATQVKLLRVLQEREVRPVGATKTKPIDVRIIAATNRDLEEMVAGGDFRNDLFYRLRVIGIEIPPLRERSEDILPLARKFVASACKTYRFSPKQLHPDAVEKLVSYSWPGNVRELANAIERAVVMASNREKIRAEDLPDGVNPKIALSHDLPGSVVPMEELEKQYIMHVLEKFSGNRAKTAKALGIGTNTLWRKLKRWGVAPAR